jgi:glutathione S-transferase
MTTPVIYGPDYSTYVRTVRLTFEEKPAEYRLEPVHFLGGEAQQPSHLRRHPFGKVPAFEHDGLPLYETDAIIRYVDQVFPGRRLQPDDPRRAARMNQTIGIIDSYGWPSIIGKIVWQRLIVPMTEKREGDEAIVRDAKPMVSLCLSEFERIKDGDRYLAGPEISLADLFLAPIFTYFTMTPDAQELLRPCPGLSTWWQEMSTWDTMVRTQPNLG